MSDALDAARRALAGERAWLVGGAVRDRLLGRPTSDFDVVVDGDPGAGRARDRARRRAARRCFALSEEFGAWRVVGARLARGRSTSEPLRGGSLEADLALARLHRQRDRRAARRGTSRSTRSAALADLDAPGACGWPGPRAFADDPLRVLRLARIAVELELRARAATRESRAREHARGARSGVSPERVFMELRRIVAAPRGAARPRADRRAAARSRSCCRSSRRCAGVEQNRFHHLDVYGHTLEVLERTVALATRRTASERASARCELERGRRAPAAARCWPSRSPTS